MSESIQSPNVYTSPVTGDGYAVVRTGACRFLGMIVENQTGSTVYAQVFDGYATPANNSKPILSLKLTANAQSVLMLHPAMSVALATGLTICSSSTGKKLTVGASTDLFISAFWV